MEWGGRRHNCGMALSGANQKCGTAQSGYNVPMTEQTPPEDGEQNLPEGAETPDEQDFKPDLPDVDSPEWQAEIALDEKEQA